MNVPRMRTVAQCIEELKKDDPQTVVSAHYIRDLIHQDKIVYTTSGRKYLVNYDKFIEFLNCEVKTNENTPVHNNIRPIRA